jgi:hypothetical protein
VNTAPYAATASKERADARRALGSIVGSAWLAAPVLVIGGTAVALWLAYGVGLGDIVRFVGYELGFVLVPGWLVYRAIVISREGRMRQLILGWSLGYLLEIGAFYVTARVGSREAFVVYPIVVGLAALAVSWTRRNQLASPDTVSVDRSALRLSSLAIGTCLCSVLLVYAALVGFEQTPLPPQVSATTYQEDTVFTISVAAETLHHWPATIPMVAGEPLHYHMFGYMHMAAIAQVTGIDLSVVIMRLYLVPLLVLLCLQLTLVGRRLGGSVSAGFLAAVVVLFLGELDVSRTKRFLFHDSFFYWLLSSHTFLFGLVCFLPTILLIGELLTRQEHPHRPRRALWFLVGIFVVGCIGSKSYSLVELVSALGLFIGWRTWRTHRLDRTALGVLALTASLYVLANALVFKFSNAGVVVKPFRTFKQMEGVKDLNSVLDPLVGTHATAILDPFWGTAGLLAIPLLGIGLLLRYRRTSLSELEAWFLALFLASLPVLILLSQPGRGQLFLFFFGAVPGMVLGACGLRLFWMQTGRAVLLRRASPRAGLVTVVVGSCLVLAALNTPLDWFPGLAGKAYDGQPEEDVELRGLTAGLYQGLRWVRSNSDSNAVLAVNNHSLHPDGRDSKYFYYSAFAERRVYLESWDYTPQTVSKNVFSLPIDRTPFPERLRLSQQIFNNADERTIRKLARSYGVRYLVADLVHGHVTPWLKMTVPIVYANSDIDVYDVGVPGRWRCVPEQPAGYAALFGHRRTPAAAQQLRAAARRVGFPGLEVQRRGCLDYAVVLTGLQSLGQARDFQREASSVGFQVTIECRSRPRRGGVNAVFGHRRTEVAAQRLADDVRALGLKGIVVQQDVCGDWEVDHAGPRTAEARRVYRLDAESVDLHVRFEPG